MSADPLNTKRPLSITVVGPVPPPPGGAGASIVSVIEALAGEPGVRARRLEWFQVWRCLLTRTDIIHFNLNRPIKRFAATLVGRMLAARVIHTVHANEFDFSLWSNKGSIALSDGFIVLNDDILARFGTHTRANVVLMTPILGSSALVDDGNLDQDTLNLLSRNSSSKIAVVYAHTKDFRRGQETYGFLFLADILPQLKAMGVVVFFLDPKAAYAPTEIDPHGSGNAVHIQRGVNFPALLRHCDVYLRPTSTDGNSVAVLEALERGVPVVASDSVPRPPGTLVYPYGDHEAFLRTLATADPVQAGGDRRSLLSTSKDYLEFVRALDYRSKRNSTKRNDESGPNIHLRLRNVWRWIRQRVSGAMHPDQPSRQCSRDQ